MILTLTTAIPDNSQLYRTSYPVRSAITTTAELIVTTLYKFAVGHVCIVRVAFV